MRVFITGVVALVLGACTPLTSARPLFSHADETGPAPLTEGVWVALDDNCTREMATASPIAANCDQLTLHHTAGGWQLSGNDKDNGATHAVTVPLIIAPAVRAASADAYAPLYVVQMSTRDVSRHSDAPGTERVYAVIAPIGALPATEIFYTSIDCAAILREGPIANISERHNADGSLSGCVASNATAVREAARRAMIQELNNVDHERMIFVHP